MGKKSTVETLPKEVKEWLDRALVESNFSGYKLLAGEMKARGYEISKSAIHRYGQDFEERLKTLKMVTEQARAVVQAAPDEDGAVNDALVRLTQEKLFGVLMEIEVDPAQIDDLTLEIWHQRVVHAYHQRGRIQLGITADNSEQWRRAAHDRDVELRFDPAAEALR